jgi:hypothetical protein
LQIIIENPNHLPFPEASIDFDIINEMFEGQDEEQPQAD